MFNHHFYLINQLIFEVIDSNWLNFKTKTRFVLNYQQMIQLIPQYILVIVVEYLQARAYIAAPIDHPLLETTVFLRLFLEPAIYPTRKNSNFNYNDSAMLALFYS